MCGIAGFGTSENIVHKEAAIKKMLAIIQHRGPDGEAAYFAEHIALGHRRLAILDLSKAGQQPMQTPDGRFVISYNGEVYNYRELRTLLIQMGYTFFSETDSEVVLNAFAAWGPQAIERFNGMFAFAIWDNKEQSLHLVRDRYGIKPLYYYCDGEKIIFGSEIKAIIASGLYFPKVDQHALKEYLTFQNFFTDRTLFEGVKLLAPASILKWQRNTGLITNKYWKFNFDDSNQISKEEATEELFHLIKQSVSRQLHSDVPVSTYLSGGIDSGLITLLANKERAGMRSFTVGFDLSSASGLELAYDERVQAERYSYLAGTEHYEMVLKAGDMERCFQKLVWHLEEPRVGQSYPNFYAAKLASHFGKVVLSGAGGDEVFAGYPWRYFSHASADFEKFSNEYYQFWQRLLTEDEHQNICKHLSSKNEEIMPKEIFSRLLKSLQQDYAHHPVNVALTFEANTFLPGLLIVEDKLSMAHGLETRIPFLDNDLVDFGMRLPLSLKLKSFENGFRVDENLPGSKKDMFYSVAKDGKQILRNVMKQYYPNTGFDNQKKGFSGPDASWFRGESIDYVNSIIENKNSKIYEYLDFSVKELVDEHLSGRKNRRLFIWSILYLENFLECFFSDQAIDVGARNEKYAQAI